MPKASASLVVVVDRWRHCATGSQVCVLFIWGNKQERECAMYIKVVLGEYSKGDYGEDGPHSASEILVNPDCPIRIIYDYILKILQVDKELELDLCDEGGILLFIYEKDPWINGMNFLVPNTTYFVVLFEKDEENRITNPVFGVSDAHKKSSTQWAEIANKVRKQLNPGLSNKPSRMSKTRVSTSHLK